MLNELQFEHYGEESEEVALGWRVKDLLRSMLKSKDIALKNQL